MDNRAMEIQSEIAGLNLHSSVIHKAAPPLFANFL